MSIGHYQKVQNAIGVVYNHLREQYDVPRPRVINMVLNELRCEYDGIGPQVRAEEAEAKHHEELNAIKQMVGVIVGIQEENTLRPAPSSGTVTGRVWGSASRPIATRRRPKGPMQGL